METVMLTGENLTLDHVIAVARRGAKVDLAAKARAAVEKARYMVEELLAKEAVVYGITTGFGKFSDVVIHGREVEDLQRNLIMSHATGVGEPLPAEVVRAVMLLRANALAKGHSGIRPETLETLIAMLNAGVHPVIPAKGSLGASGDLAPLAHMVLPLIGLGEAEYRGERMTGEQAMRTAGLAPVTLTAKEGLALINGTQVMTAIAALAVYDGENLLKTANTCAALTVEALRGIGAAFDEKVHAVRPHPGQQAVAAEIRRLTAGSKLLSAPGQVRVQDAYTLRCIPQVHGATADALAYVRRVVETEINSATDNPLLFPEQGEVISGGNFHGQPLAIAMDFLGIAVAELANISERRIERLINPQLSSLPAFLTKSGGLNSGLMIAQYTAAALVSENKVLAHPASVDSIPSSANQEDHVSMGTIAARKTREILNNTAHVLAIELITACQALEFTDPGKLGSGTTEAYRRLRKHIPPLANDRVLYPDIQAVTGLIRENCFVI